MHVYLWYVCMRTHDVTFQYVLFHLNLHLTEVINTYMYTLRFKPAAGIFIKTYILTQTTLSDIFLCKEFHQELRTINILGKL